MRLFRVVVLGGQVSDWRDILGVSQGSVLGSLLFVIYIYIYINDIDESLNSKILKFADDTKIHSKVQ